MPPEEASMVFPPCGSLLELWSGGVMKGPIQVEIQAFAFANTPILQYSSIPKQLANFTGKATAL
jgi:hypothetical protein